MGLLKIFYREFGAFTMLLVFLVGALTLGIVAHECLHVVQFGTWDTISFFPNDGGRIAVTTATNPTGAALEPDAFALTLFVFLLLSAFGFSYLREARRGRG